MKNYTVYHLHDETSLLDSCTNFKLYVDRAIELEQKAVAFTNHGSIYNWVDKKLYCDEKNIKYIHGVEIYLTEGLEENIRDNYHTILLAKNYEGVKEINTLIDLSSTESHFYYKPRITFEEFFNISNNVIKISACLASPLNKINHRIKKLEEECGKIQEEFLGALDNEDSERFIDDISQEFHNDIKIIEDKITSLKNNYIKLCKAYDYYEIQPHVNSEDQKEYNSFLLELSKQHNKPLIAGTDTHSINKYKAQCRMILQKAKKMQFADEDAFDLTYKSYTEVVEMFKEQGVLEQDVYLTALENTNIVADMVEDFELDKSFKYPPLYEDDESVFKQRLQSMLKQKIDNGEINNSNIQEYVKRINEEFEVFKKINMVGYMLFMSELMEYCRENGIYYSPGRGSVSGSEIAYVSGITDVNPVVWNTVFSRFANEDRKEIGDIDLDFFKEDRPLVYKYIIDRFGEDYTAYILAMSTISDKGTIDEIGRALSFMWEERNPGRDNSQNPFNLSVIEGIKREYEEDPIATREKYPKIFYFFDGLVNTTVAQSMHPAGIVASPITLTDNYGTFYNNGKRILCINMEEIHEINLVKYDILGLKQCGIISEACRLANVETPVAYKINWDDQNVWNDILESPIGIFQFESKFAFESLKTFKPRTINDLNLITACIRPSGASYRDRLLAREFNSNPSEQIDELLSANNGFLVFQEDTIQFLQQICGLSGSEADNIRRAIARKQKDRLEKALPQIVDGYCSKSTSPREVAEEEVKEFLQIIEDSSDYQFG